MNFFRKYLLPGFIFQSLIIGGGYATGRELVEFFFSAGPIGGTLGLIVSGIIFGIVLATGFELARVTQTYDYRKFCSVFLGKGWFLFEIVFILQMLLVLSVVSSAASNIAEVSFGFPAWLGGFILTVVIAVIVFFGTEAIKRVLSVWSLLLYAVYITLFYLAFQSFGTEINDSYAQADVNGSWLTDGILYSGYNVAALPLILYAVSSHKTSQETIGAGFIAGFLAVIPAILFFVSMMGKFPEIGEQPVPASYLMSSLNAGWLEFVFHIVIFGTFIETGAAMLHAVNERISVSLDEQGKKMPASMRPLISVGFLLVAVFLAEKYGIIQLIAQGYGFLTMIFIIILIIPLMTVGVWKIVQRRS